MIVIAVIALLILLIPSLIEIIPLIEQSGMGMSIEPVNIEFPRWFDAMLSVFRVGAILCIGIIVFILYYSNRQRRI